MLHEFVTANRAEIITRCRALISSRPVPSPTEKELEFGVPLFLDQLASALRLAQDDHPEINLGGTKHGDELMQRGFTVAQVVHDYGGICQTITELAVEKAAPITASEFQTLNLCLDNAIAGAVTEYARLRAHEGTERLGVLAHELRNTLASALLSYQMLGRGTVGIGGSTSRVLGRSLARLGNLIDRELADVRLDSGIHSRETVVVHDFIEDVALLASMEAEARGLHLSIAPIATDVTVHADRQTLVSVVSNLLHNALKFTHADGQVLLRAHATTDRVLIEVEDQCGGLPPGKAEEMFRPFAQKGADRSGLGLGLAICERGAKANDGEIRVLNHAGTGCVFTLDLPRQARTATA